MGRFKSIFKVLTVKLFVIIFNLSNTVYWEKCFMENSNWMIDLFLTNKSWNFKTLNFKKTLTLVTGVSDSHEIITTPSKVYSARLRWWLHDFCCPGWNSILFYSILHKLYLTITCKKFHPDKAGSRFAGTKFSHAIASARLSGIKKLINTSVWKNSFPTHITRS